MAQRNRYRMEPLPGLEDLASTQQWGSSAPRQEVQQGWLPFSDGAQLGPLFAATQGQPAEPSTN